MKWMLKGKADPAENSPRGGESRSDWQHHCKRKEEGGAKLCTTAEEP